MPSSGRYRSNLFNVLSRQSMRLQDRASQTWRQAKTAALWGVQILLYPLYVGFQVTRLVGKQLRQTARQVLPKLRAVAQPVTPTEPFLFADTSIQRSLQTLRDFALLLPADRLALQLDPQNPSAPGIWVVVGGSAIASSLSSSSLSSSLLSRLFPTSSELPGSRELLASKELPPQNTLRLEIVGSSTKLVLAPSEWALPERALPDKISDKIKAAEHPSGVIQIQGIAALLESHRLVLVDVQNQLLDVLSSDQQMLLQRRIAVDVAGYGRQQRGLAENQLWVDRFLPLPKERTLALPPIRAFWQLITWMQTSSVAVATNLFQESQLPLLPPHSQPIADISTSNGALALRSAETSWKTSDALLQNLSQWFRNRLQNFTPALELSIIKDSSRDLLQASSTEVQSHPDSNPASLYPAFSDPVPSDGLPSPQIFSERMSQWGGWLRRSPPSIESTRRFISDLITDSSFVTDSSSHPVENPPQDLPSALSRSVMGELVAKAVPSSAPLPMKMASPRLISNPGMLSHLGAPLQPGEAQIVSATVRTSSAEQAAEKPELVVKPTWLEAEVRLVAYEKHPLEQLLDWIDHRILWVEDRVIAVWKWLRDRWSA